MTFALPDGAPGAVGPEAWSALRERLVSADALAVGPGLSRTPESAAFVEHIVSGAEIPLVLDADALQALADARPAKPAWRSGAVVLTPHPGEMARLLGQGTADVQADRVAAARECAARFRAVTVLKGARTVVAAPDGGVWINPTGNAGMAAAGMGDVLTGVIAAHLARGIPPLEAALLGVYLHGLAGDLEAAATGPWGLLASDLADRLPAAVRRLANHDADRATPELTLLIA
jgi:NAD(P)H-hydrate epimerase